MTWELTLARPLMLVHALTGFAALAISLHVLYFAWLGGGPKASGARAKARRYTAVAWPMYLAALLSGVIPYAVYKINVREAYLDAHQPAMTGLFEIKEHWGAIGLLLAWSLWRHYCRSTHEQLAMADLRFWRGQAWLALLLVVCAALNVIAGVWITMIKSV